MHNHVVSINSIINQANKQGNHVVEDYALQLDYLLHENKNVDEQFVGHTIEFLERLIVFAG